MVASRNVCLVCLFALTTFVSASAQTATSELRGTEPSQGGIPNPVETSQSAQQYVNERLAVWQQRMKLEAWRISVVQARSSELKPKTLGAIRWDKGKKTAVIWVLDPADYQLPYREMLDDMELTIVHELIHLDLASPPRSEASRSSEEHAVNGIADALLGLDRKKQ
jgi:hypothetical protein